MWMITADIPWYWIKTWRYLQTDFEYYSRFPNKATIITIYCTWHEGSKVKEKVSSSYLFVSDIAFVRHNEWHFLQDASNTAYISIYLYLYISIYISIYIHNVSYIYMVDETFTVTHMHLLPLLFADCLTPQKLPCGSLSSPVYWCLDGVATNVGPTQIRFARGSPQRPLETQDNWFGWNQLPSAATILSFLNQLVLVLRH